MMYKNAFIEGFAKALSDSGALKGAAEKGKKVVPGSLRGGTREPAAPGEYGSGSRFEALVKKLKGKGGVEDPKALAAALGRAAHGKKSFQAAAKGKGK